MVTAVNGKTIIRIPAKQATLRLSGLKNVFSINAFEFGKRSLGSTITKMFNKIGDNVKEIMLDNAAKARLIAMPLLLEKRIENGETIDRIFTDLKLSLFLTEDQDLYILGDPKNVAQMKKSLPALNLVDSIPADIPKKLAVLEKKFSATKNELSLEQKQKHKRQLNAMGIKMVHASPGSERTEFPDWLKEDIFLNFDLAMEVFKMHGKAKTADMFKSIGNPELLEIIKKHGVAPFIELMKTAGMNEYTSSFGDWLISNLELINKFGIAPYLLVAPEAQENIDATWFYCLPKLKNYINSAEDLAALGILLAKKLDALSDSRTKQILSECLRSFTPSAQNIETTLKDLDEFIPALDRMYNKISPPRDYYREEPRDLFSLAFGDNKRIIDKIGIASFEKVILKLATLDIDGKTIEDVESKIKIMQTFPLFESEMNTAEDFEQLYNIFEEKLNAYQSQKTMFIRNLTQLIEAFKEQKINVNFSLTCNLASLFFGMCIDPVSKNVGKLIKIFGEEAVAELANVLPSSSESEKNIEVCLDCEAFMDSPEDFSILIEMIKSGKEISVQNFMKEKDKS